MGQRLYSKTRTCHQSYDTAFLKKETADYSAITTWGVFHESPTALRT